MLRVHQPGHWQEVRRQDHLKGHPHSLQGQGKSNTPLTQLASEIEIHKSIRSEFVVKYERSFEDSANVYIILELCPNQTLNELIKRRKRITEL